jgi:hypothetical protein
MFVTFALHQGLGRLPRSCPRRPPVVLLSCGKCEHNCTGKTTAKVKVDNFLRAEMHFD